jgi:gamma-glutamylcyclotransferase (GGCT)/AIG2-like uncharacterized protein YtfP
MDPVPRMPYFAYGSNLIDTQMLARCDGARVVGAARLDGHRFLINQRGVATVVPATSGAVHGLLWRCDDRHIAALDHYEGVDVGHYERRVLPVEHDGRAVPAWVYVALHDEPGLPRPGYLPGIVSAASELGLPDDYIAELTGWGGSARRPDGRDGRTA